MIAQENQPEQPEDGNNNRADIAAVIFVVVLVAFGIWVFNTLGTANDKLNCIASGRTNCANLSR